MDYQVLEQYEEWYFNIEKLFEVFSFFDVIINYEEEYFGDDVEGVVDLSGL